MQFEKIPFFNYNKKKKKKQLEGFLLKISKKIFFSNDMFSSLIKPKFLNKTKFLKKYKPPYMIPPVKNVFVSDCRFYRNYKGPIQKEESCDFLDFQKEFIENKKNLDDEFVKVKKNLSRILNSK